MPPLTDLSFFRSLPPDDQTRVEGWLAYAEGVEVAPRATPLEIHGPVRQESLEGLYQELLSMEQRGGLGNGLVPLFGELRRVYVEPPVSFVHHDWYQVTKTLQTAFDNGTVDAGQFRRTFLVFKDRFGAQPPAAIGYFGDLPALLIATEHTPEQIRHFMDQVKEILQRPQNQPILQDTVTFLNDGGLSRCIIAVFKPRAAMTPGEPLAFYTNSPLNQLTSQVPLSQLNPTTLRSATILPPPVPENQLGIASSFHTISFLTGATKDGPQAFFHEATHYADQQLFSRWIEANQRLERAGYTTDQLYQYAIREHNGYVVIDRAVYVLFTESRAYAVTHYFDQQRAGRSLPEDDYRNNTLWDIDPTGEGREPLLQVLQITGATVWERAKRCRDIMENTIRQANSVLNKGASPTGSKIGGSALGALLLGVGLAHGIPHTQAQELSAQHPIQVASPHGHHQTSHFQHSFTHRPSAHSSAHDLSLHNNLPLWGSASAMTLDSMSFSLAETMGI